ncbi:DUF763 domain-containing protein [Treponema pectinovorum]|uniref:DUF763 domain-containing protein n=1 Tax=Treponema pectinovorum TaxID=164 RepID=UPI003D8DB2FE
MIKRAGYADLPLHTGVVPRWLADRMMSLGTAIMEALILRYGKKEALVRLSDPLWFQSFGCVLGMDWHSSGITTSVMYALKRGLNRRAKELGLVVCGGRGKYSRKTPEELQILADMTGMDSNYLINSSKLAAKVDGCAVQDGFSLYQHNFILSDEGDWVVVQQGMNTGEKKARRYHWSSQNLRSFVENPHSGVTGENKGAILNLADSLADNTRSKILTLTHENPDKLLKEIKKIYQSESAQLELFNDAGETKTNIEEIKTDESKNNIGQTSILIKNDRNLVMPARHELKAQDVDLKKLGAVLATAYESDNKNFESLLLTQGLGARTLQSLTLVSEVIFGTPSRFTDPARFSFAHGGKDGHPFPVPTKIYDESIRILSNAIEESKLGYNEKSECLYRLHKTAKHIEKNCLPEADFEKTIDWEKRNSKNWDGKTC